MGILSLSKALWRLAVLFVDGCIDNFRQCWGTRTFLHHFLCFCLARSCFSFRTPRRRHTTRHGISHRAICSDGCGELLHLPHHLRHTLLHDHHLLVSTLHFFVNLSIDQIGKLRHDGWIEAPVVRHFVIASSLRSATVSVCTSSQTFPLTWDIKTPLRIASNFVELVTRAQREARRVFPIPWDECMKVHSLTVPLSQYRYDLHM